MRSQRIRNEFATEQQQPMSQTLHGYTFTKKLLVVHVILRSNQEAQFLSGGHTLSILRNAVDRAWFATAHPELGPPGHRQGAGKSHRPQGRGAGASLLPSSLWGTWGFPPGRLWPPYSVRFMEFCPGARTPGVGALPYSSIRRDPAMTSGHFALFWAPDPHSQ